jgi:hypothetical protein
MEQQLTEAEKEMLAAVDQKRQEDSKLQYHDAVKLVASEKPELARRYRRATLGMMKG